MRKLAGLLLIFATAGCINQEPDNTVNRDGENAAADGAQAGGEGIAWLKVEEVAYVNEGCRRNAGVKLSLVGEFAGVVLKASFGTLTAATTDTGANLLTHELDRSIDFPWVGEDRKSVAFDVTLQLPPPGSKGYKEIAGTLTCVTGGKTRDVDLGITELKAETKGKDAWIAELRDSPLEEGRQKITIAIEMSNVLIGSVVILDESGKALPTEAEGYMDLSDQVLRTLSLKGKFPAKGSVIAKVYENAKTCEIPFKLENLDLLGRPLK